MGQPEKTIRPRRIHVRSKDREYLTSNLALMLQAAVPVGTALQSLRETSHSKHLNKVLQQMIADVEEGVPLWKALERSGLVSKQTLALVRLGEESGSLIENLSVAAKQEEKQRAFRAKLHTALLYPAFVLGVTVVVGLGVAWFLLPRLAETFSQLHIRLPLVSRMMIRVGLFLKDHGAWAVPLMLLGVLLVVYILFIEPKTRRAGQWVLFHIPGISKLLHEVEIAQFGYLLGTLLNAGLSVTQALRLVYDATDTFMYAKFYGYLYQSFDNGYSFKTSFATYKSSAWLLSPAVQQMIIAGERSGSLPQTLLSVGDIYTEKANTSTQNLETVLEPILLVIVWLGVLLVAVSIILPIYSLVGGLGTQ